MAYARRRRSISRRPLKVPSTQVKAVIATATSRLLEGDLACDPRLPTEVQARLEQLACKWMQANPVTELFWR